MRIFLSLCCCFLFLSVGQAQTQKIAYIDKDAIVADMPEYKRAKSELESFTKQLQNKVKAEEEKLLKFQQETMQQATGMPQEQLQKKEAEFLSMQENLQKLAAQADQDLIKKERELIKPIFDKLQIALNMVGKAQGYAYVFDKKFFLYSDGGINADVYIRSALGI